MVKAYKDDIKIPNSIMMIRENLFEKIRIEIHVKKDIPPTKADAPIITMVAVLLKPASHPKNLNPINPTMKRIKEYNHTFRNIFLKLLLGDFSVSID